MTDPKAIDISPEAVASRIATLRINDESLGDVTADAAATLPPPVNAFRCTYCGVELTALAGHKRRPFNLVTRDHVIPNSLLAEGENSEETNCCWKCNGMKGDTPPEVFRAYLVKYGHGAGEARRYRRFCYELMRSAVSAGLADAITLPKLKRRDVTIGQMNSAKNGLRRRDRSLTELQRIAAYLHERKNWKWEAKR